MSYKKNILIISYFFPPCNKVGGRRWAKFAKVLTRRNYDVNVICVDVPFKGKCPWENDIAEYKNNIHRIPYIEHRPYYIVNKAPSTFSGKIKYRLSLYNHKFLRGNKSITTDASEIYVDTVRSKARSIIKSKGINSVIITGGPFHWCYEAMKLKKEFPDLKFTLDLRDFWTSGDGYTHLEQHLKNSEDSQENFCIESADTVFTPAERIQDYLKSKYKLQSGKINLLAHGYDKDELNLSQSTTESSAITFAYGGILYSNMGSSISRFIELLKAILKKGHSIKVNIYTFEQNYREQFTESGLQEYVQYHSSVTPQELFRIFSNTDYLLQLRAGNSLEQHFKSTKFYELIALKKPVIYFGPEGDVSEFLTEKKLGFSGNEDIETLSEKIISNKKSKNVPDKNFNVSAFEFEQLTTQLENFL